MQYGKRQVRVNGFGHGLPRSARILRQARANRQHYRICRYALEYQSAQADQKRERCKKQKYLHWNSNISGWDFPRSASFHEKASRIFSNFAKKFSGPFNSLLNFRPGGFLDFFSSSQGFHKKALAK